MALTLFMYHRVLPEKCPGALTTVEFERSLDYLQTHYRMLPAAEVESFVSGGFDVRGDAAALSFDDAWADNFFYASPVLKRRGLSALLAVSAGCLHDGEVRESVPREIMYRSMDEAQAAARAGDPSTYLNRAELAAMQASGVWRIEVHGTRRSAECPRRGGKADRQKAPDALLAVGALLRRRGRNGARMRFQHPVYGRKGVHPLRRPARRAASRRGAAAL